MNQLMQLYLDNRSIPKVPVSVVRTGDVASISMRGIVIPEEGINAEEVAHAIAQAGDASTIVFNINTPGGSVFEAREIMDIIRNTSAKTVAHIGSLCASAGTSIALACDEVEMADGAHFMIHNAQAVIGGDKTALRKAADTMEKIEQAIVNDYTTKTGKDAAEIIQMMDATTWMTAQEALAGGFIDRIAEAAKKAKNTWNLAAFGNAPAALLRNKSDDTADLSEQEKKFLQDMLPHHEMAIEMARAILPNAASEKVRGLAEAIIAAQAGEIALIETWLADTAAPENKKKPMKPMKMQTDDPATKQNEEPAPEAGFFMSAANANRLRLATIS